MFYSFCCTFWYFFQMFVPQAATSLIIEINFFFNIWYQMIIRGKLSDPKHWAIGISNGNKSLVWRHIWLTHVWLFLAFEARQKYGSWGKWIYWLIKLSWYYLETVFSFMYMFLSHIGIYNFIYCLQINVKVWKPAGLRTFGNMGPLKPHS